MGSSTYNDASQKQLEDELIDAGSRLLMLPSSTDELLILLEKAESLLTKVRQQPPRSTGDALLPAIKALVTDELLRHTDVNIQVAVASCINELTRITAPEPPYSDDEMKEVFQLFMIAFKQLSFEPGCNYSRATQILETVAKVRSCLILLDIGCDALVIEMFQLFFATIRSSHSSNILKYMEMIMTLVIEESDEISLELLRPLLASIKMVNKNISPVSWELGKTVLNNCVTKLQPYLREAVKLMNVDLDDYAEILSSLCVDKSDGKTMVAKEVASASQIASVGLSDAGVSKLDGLSKIELEDGTPFIKDGGGNEQLMSNSARSDVKVVHTAGIVQSGTDKGSVRRRGRKPNSLVKLKDGYECSLATGGIDSCNVSCNGENKEDLALPSELGKGNVLNDSSKKEYHSEVNGGSLRRRGRSKKTENMSNQPGNSSPARRILRTTVKESCSNGSKRAGKKGFTGLKIIEANKMEGNLDNNAKGKDGLLLPELVEGKRISDEIISQKHESVSDKDKMMEYPSLSEPAKAKNLSDFASKKEKKSTRFRVSYGDELVNLRIQVWWPMDKRFYAGTVKAFDPLTKKHEIKYDDDEVEVLLLRKERWELLGDKKPGQAPTQRKIADHLSPAKDPVKTPIITAKRKTVSSGKHHAASSSKRSKSESLGGLKTGENSAPDDIHLKDESNNKTSETIVSSKDVRENHAGKEE